MNVLLYVLDAFRADHCSCYGYERDTTPTIDSLATEGVRFAQCFSPSTWTRPVAASVLTGLYPPAHGTRTKNDSFDPPRPPLAERFVDGGFETVGITAMGNVSSTTNFHRGFDRFFDLYKDERIIEKRSTSTSADEELRDESGIVALPRAEDITETFGRWLQNRDDQRPFFAFAWSIEPHIPYNPPDGYKMYRDPGYDGPVDGTRGSLKRVTSEADLEHLKALYDEEIRYNDAEIGWLLDHLRTAGEYEDTAIVVIGDHGDAFNEHGRLTHGHSPHEEVIHVPWVVKTPGNVTGNIVSEQVGLVDVYSTLLEYATDPSLSDGSSPVGGHSQAGVLTGKGPDEHEQLFFETKSYDMQNAFYGVRTPEWKYIEVEGPETNLTTTLDLLQYVLTKDILLDILRNPMYYWQRYRYEETRLLFDLTSDPGEQENVIEDYPEIGEKFDVLLQAWRETCEDFRDAATNGDTDLNIDAQTREQLRELGYAE